jgi:hypothetical protein
MRFFRAARQPRAYYSDDSIVNLELNGFVARPDKSLSTTKRNSLSRVFSFKPKLFNDDLLGLGVDLRYQLSM